MNHLSSAVTRHRRSWRLLVLGIVLVAVLGSASCGQTPTSAQTGQAQSDKRKVERLRPLRKLEGHGDIVTALAFSPDGETLASGSHDQRVILWDIQNEKPHRTLEGHHYWISSIAFSSDARVLASTSNRDMSFLVVEGKAPISSGGPQGEVLLWDVNSGKLKQKLGKAAPLNDMSSPDLRELYPSTGVAFWPNGRTVAVASYIAYVRFWDINTGQYQPPLLSFRGTIEGIAFSPNGNSFAVARSNEAVLYDTAWGKEDCRALFPRRERRHKGSALFAGRGEVGHCRQLRGCCLGRANGNSRSHTRNGNLFARRRILTRRQIYRGRVWYRSLTLGSDHRRCHPKDHDRRIAESCGVFAGCFDSGDWRAE